MKEFIKRLLQLLGLYEDEAINWDESLLSLGELRWAEWGLTSEGLPAFWSELLRLVSQSLLRGEPRMISRELLGLKRRLTNRLGLNREEQALFDREYALFSDYVQLLGGRKVTRAYQVEGEWIICSRHFIKALFNERLCQVEVAERIAELAWTSRLSVWLKEFKIFDELSGRLLVEEESNSVLSLYSYGKGGQVVHSNVFYELFEKLTKYCQQLLRLVSLRPVEEAEEEASVSQMEAQLLEAEELWMIAKRHRLLPELVSYKVFDDLEQLYRRVEEEIASVDEPGGVSFAPQAADREPAALLEQIEQDMAEMKRYGEGLTRLAGMESLRDEGAGIDLYFKAFQWIDKTFRAYSERLYAYRMEREGLLRAGGKEYLAQLSALDKELLAIDGRLVHTQRACLQEVNELSGKESLRHASECLSVLVSDELRRLSGMVEWIETSCYCQARTEEGIAPEMNARNNGLKKIEENYGVWNAFTQTDYLVTESRRTQAMNSILRKMMLLFHVDQLRRHFPSERYPKLYEIADYCFQEVCTTQQRLQRAKEVWYAGQWYASSPDTLDMVERRVLVDYKNKQPEYLEDPGHRLDLKALSLQQEYLSWAVEQPSLNKQPRGYLGSQHYLHGGADNKTEIAWSNLLFKGCHALIIRGKESKRIIAATEEKIRLTCDEIARCAEEIKQIREKSLVIDAKIKQLQKPLLKAMIRDLKEQFEGADNLRELLLDEIASRFYLKHEGKRSQVLEEDLELAIEVFQAAGCEHWAACLKNDVVVTNKTKISSPAFFAHEPLSSPAAPQSSSHRVLRCDKSALFNPL